MESGRPAVETIDYPIQDALRLRLIDATAADAARIERRLGLARDAPSGDPHFTIRYVDTLPSTGPRFCLGVADAEFDARDFLIVRTERDGSRRVALDFGRADERVEIVAERGITAIPLLVPLLNLAMLHQGFVPLHASALWYQGQGVLVTGWSKSGKTETVLTLMQDGAEYIGDEWIFLSPGGERMFGLPWDVNLWEWHLREVGRYHTLLSSGVRRRFWLASRALHLLESVARNPWLRGVQTLSSLEWLTPEIRRRMAHRLPPRALFDQRLREHAPLDMILYVGTHTRPGVEIRPADPLAIARRMQISNRYERRDLVAGYLKYRFAFPDRAPDLLERTDALEARLLREALEGRPAFTVHHAYPISMRELGAAVRDVLKGLPE